LTTDWQLTLEAVPDVGLAEVALQARYEREQTSLATFRMLEGRFSNLAAVHRWLYAEHGAYAIAQTPCRLNNAALETY
jgi:two-component sensor histidine kinase